MNQYYPPTNEGRADWWQNVANNNTLLTGLGFTAPETFSVLKDATYGVYLYRTVRKAFEDWQSVTVAWCDVYTDSAPGAPAPDLPVVPAWPALPPDGIEPGLEARRVQWVEQARSAATYNPSIGMALGIEPTGTPFDPSTYQAVIFGLTSPAARTVSGKFRKANGNVDGINLYGRKEGTMTWILLGRFTAMPFSALVPLAGAAPEPWEFLARAVKRDVEIGVASDVVQVIVRG